MCSVVQTPRFGQLVNVVAETVGTQMLSNDVDISMCILRSFTVFVIIIVVATVADITAGAAAAAATVMTKLSFLAF